MKKHETKVENFLCDQLANSKNLSLLFIKLSNNIYLLFGKYIITNEKNECIVELNNKKISFGSLKTALTWCGYKERQMISECKHIEYIDNKLIGLEVEISQHNFLMRKTKDKGLIHIYDSKIQESYHLKNILLKKMNKYINIAKRWQIQRYNLAKTSIRR